jgi:hypothetical protein
VGAAVARSWGHPAAHSVITACNICILHCRSCSPAVRLLGCLVGWRSACIAPETSRLCTDLIMLHAHQVDKVLVLEDSSVPLSSVHMAPGRDVAWAAVVPLQAPACDPVWLEANEVGGAPSPPPSSQSSFPCAALLMYHTVPSPPEPSSPLQLIAVLVAVAFLLAAANVCSLHIWVHGQAQGSGSCCRCCSCAPSEA